MQKYLKKSLKPDSLWGLIGVLQRHLEEADWEVFVHLRRDPQSGGVCHRVAKVVRVLPITGLT